MRDKGLVQEYLNYYPEEKNIFKHYRYKIKNYIYYLHYYYVKCYILQENSLKSYPKKYRKHIYFLHKEYKRTGVKRTYNRIKKYFNRLSFIQQTVIS